MSGPVVIAPKYHRLGEGFSRREKAQASEHPGRRTDPKRYQSAASWVLDLVELRKTVLLCSFCRIHFNPRKFRYRVFYAPSLTSSHVNPREVNGHCDGCKQPTANLGGGTCFVAEETFHLICTDPGEARQKQRAAAKSLSAWQTIQRTRRSK
jgi:hypothetical protein